ncbi:hypothetical protein BUN12_0015 [Bacillus amyloliquefaciens]|nr:hypothetical protein BUN12_0015 [Bacillus amyloliquefaciens]
METIYAHPFETSWFIALTFFCLSCVVCSGKSEKE